MKIGKHIGSLKSSAAKNNNNYFTIKGKSSSDEFLVSKDELLAAISRLRESDYTPIRKLSGSLKQDYLMVSKYVELTHQTNTYDMLKSLIDEKFYDLEKVIPGTVGAYFYGSNLNVNMDPKECAATTANSIPVDSNTWNKCKNHMVLADRTDKGYDFSLLSEGDDRSHAYVFLRHDSYDDFEGFSTEEKRKLKKLGVEYLYLYGYGEDTTQYNDLVGTAVAVDECKHRKHQEKKESSSNWLLWLIMIIFVIVLICVICWSFWGGYETSEVKMEY